LVAKPFQVSTRGKFLEAITLATVGPAVPRFSAGIQKPPLLRRGDRVGLIAPASPPTDGDIGLATAHVESLGLVPVLGRYVQERDGYLAGSDAQRAADFNTMARDADIRAIVAIRGGYGTMRILTLLDYQAIRRDPKIVMGFSDLTAILNAVAARSGVVTFHGPVGAHGSSWSGAARTYLEDALFTAVPRQLRVEGAQPIVAGRARGRLAGGNLSLIASLVGTPFAVPAADSLLFFEETQEAPFRIDRMLTQLDLSGELSAARGVLVGQCTKCIGESSTQSASQVIAERLRSLGRPATAGAPVGHIATQWVVPIGVLAELDATAGTLTLLEPAVTQPRGI
jgi:muramoyltetrapeptide carboxypeptidase